ncbi:hypothetical protein AMATHDRAFT_51642 [Amanita thiersii Skay4041]|uniref:Peptidase M43 pregnancy-associated plasma-A domain-containing protein n=1 Tax=Amanita thiersii Skay4041 TaxID=703135 RepID=A0A2A9N8N6_9AGAR|nr:hypothetical protein AMATHDRAFT_51642 [Amanita thiersii Skay4041]
MKLLTIFLYTAIVLAVSSKTTGLSCGTFINEEDKAAAEAWFKVNKVDLNSTSAAYTPASLNVYFHVIEAQSGGNVDSKIPQQMQVMNTAFANSSVQWLLTGTTHIINSNWYNLLSTMGTHWQQSQMKASLRQGGAADLNVYVVGSITSGTTSLLGYSTYPWNYSLNPRNDGIVITADALPGGFISNSLGMTLVHETGHWGGLYHTFEGGCDGPGDEVLGTPAEARETFGCPTNQDTCSGDGPDPIHNFMDSTDDICKNNFTPGQIERFRVEIATYRGVAL